MLILRHKIPGLLYADKGNTLSRPHNSDYQKRKCKISLLHTAKRISESRGDRHNTRYHKKQAHIGTDSRHRADLLPFLLLQAQRRQHGPVGNIIRGIGQPPGDIDQGKHRNISCPLKTEIREKQYGKHTGYQSPQRDPGFEFPEPGFGIINDHPHDRIVERIKNTGTKNNNRNPPQGRRRQFNNVRKIINQIHTHHGIDHIPAYRA